MKASPRLHRTKLTGMWAVSGTHLLLVHGCEGWHFSAAKNTSTESWLVRHGLSGAEFDRRLDAMNALTAVLDLHPSPRPEELPIEPLRRVRAGEHRTRDGRYRVLRQQAGWVIFKDGKAFSAPMFTLRRAASALAYIRERHG